MREPHPLDTSVEQSAALVKIYDPGWISGGMPIAAGDPDVVYSVEIGNPLGQEVLLWAANLHQHLIGKSASLIVHHANGTDECALNIPEWDFHWQGTYFLVEPIVVGPDDSIELECHWDASAATEDLNWGEGSEDEMCVGLVYGTLGG